VVLFFYGGQGSNLKPCIYYALFLSTELISSEQKWFCLPRHGKS